MITKELQDTLTAAREEAIKRRHEYVTLEHLLLSLLDDRTASEVIRHCGGDIDVLKKELEQFFDEHKEEVGPVGKFFGKVEPEGFGFVKFALGEEVFEGFVRL